MVSMLTIVVFGFALVAGVPKPKLMKVIVKPHVKTTNMGGVAAPSPSRQCMTASTICGPRGGELTKVPVVKTLLPHCTKIGLQVDLGPQGTIYSRQKMMLCKSTDGERTWSSQPMGWTIEKIGR